MPSVSVQYLYCSTYAQREEHALCTHGIQANRQNIIISHIFCTVAFTDVIHQQYRTKNECNTFLDLSFDFFNGSKVDKPYRRLFIKENQIDFNVDDLFAPEQQFHQCNHSVPSIE